MAAHRGRVSVGITGDSQGLKRSVRESETALSGLGKATERVNEHISHHRGELLKYAKAATGVGAAYSAITDAKDAIETTDQLAKATLVLSRNFGLSVDTASKWAAVAKSRDVDPTALHQGFTKLSRSVESAAAGSKQARAAFMALGLTQGDLKRGQGDFEGLLGKVGKAFSDMKGSTERATLAQTLFGRGARSLLPLLRQGPQGFEAQAAMAEKYGATLKDKTVGQVEKLVVAQREASFATLGLQIAFGTQLAPALTKATNATSHFILGMRTGTGAGGDFADAMKPIVHDLGTVAKFLSAHPHLIAAAVAAWGAYKVAGVAAALATRVQLLQTFVGLGPRAAAGGAVAGRSFGTAAAAGAGTTFAAGAPGALGGGKLRGAMRGAGTALGAVVGAAMVGEIINQVQGQKGGPLRDVLRGLLPLSPQPGTSKVTPYTPPKGAPPYQRDKGPLRTGDAEAQKRLGSYPDSHKRGYIAAASAAASANVAASAARTNVADPVGFTARATSAGGSYSFEQLQALWIQAGGDPGAAAIMAHIALAESGGDPSVNNGHRAGDGGRTVAAGLWQILGLPFPGNVYDPITNARMAIAKSNNGRNLHPWDASRASWGRYVGQPAATISSATTSASHAPAAKRLTALTATLGHTLVARPSPSMVTPAFPKETATSLDLQAARAANMAAQAEATGNTDLAKTANVTRRFQIGMRLNRLQYLLSRAGGTKAQRQKYLEEQTQLYQELAPLQQGWTDLTAPPESPSVDDVVAGNATAVAKALDFVDREEYAQVISADDAKAQRHQIRQGALTGAYGMISPADYLQIRGDDLAALADAQKQQGETLDDIKQLMAEQNDLMKQQLQEAQRRANVAEAQAPQFLRWLSDAVSGQVGGKIGLGFQTPSYAGGVARP